jgi:hypothetical protein
MYNHNNFCTNTYRFFYKKIPLPFQKGKGVFYFYKKNINIKYCLSVCYANIWLCAHQQSKQTKQICNFIFHIYEFIFFYLFCNKIQDSFHIIRVAHCFRNGTMIATNHAYRHAFFTFIIFENHFAMRFYAQKIVINAV